MSTVQPLGEPVPSWTGTWPYSATTATNTTAGGITINVTSPLVPSAEQAASDAKKPYGDVTYADPGYQKDGKKRYPIDTADHVRAAWSYINQGDNAGQYSSEQVSQIKGRIRAAAKRFGIALGGSEKSAVLCEVAGRLLLTAPADVVTDPEQLPREMAAAFEQASSRNPHWLWLSGRFVEAEQPNANGAYWSTQDLEFGELSVNHAPLNFLHQSDRIIGTITQARLYYPQQAGDRAHIAAQSVVWKPYHPHEAALIEAAAAQGNLWYSMECVGESVTCETSTEAGREGCGSTFAFAEVYAAPDRVCAHLRERTSQLHINRPTFIGGAVIVPPAAPAWRNADLEVAETVQQLAAQTYREAAARAVSPGQWEALMADVVAFASGD